MIGGALHVLSMYCRPLIRDYRSLLIGYNEIDTSQTNPRGGESNSSMCSARGGDHARWQASSGERRGGVRGEGGGEEGGRGGRQPAEGQKSAEMGRNVRKWQKSAKSGRSRRRVAEVRKLWQEATDCGRSRRKVAAVAELPYEEIVKT